MLVPGTSTPPALRVAEVPGLGLAVVSGEYYTKGFVRPIKNFARVARFGAISVWASTPRHPPEVRRWQHYRPSPVGPRQFFALPPSLRASVVPPPTPFRIVFEDPPGAPAPGEPVALPPHASDNTGPRTLDAHPEA